MKPRALIPPDPAGARLGPFWLMPGVSRGNALTLVYGGFSSICLITFILSLQPYVLEVVLHVPKARQGSLTGLLGFLQEFVLLLLVGVLGAASDQIGRRIIYVAGLMVMAAAYFVYPLAGSEFQLIAFRMCNAVGYAAVSVMMHTCFAEYSQNASRGRWMGMVGVCNGLGASVTAAVLARLPLWYGGLGLGAVAAVRFSFWTMSAYALFLTVVLRLGLKGPAVRPMARRDSLLRLAARGLAAARHNPPLALAYATSFASRGDLAIITTFSTLWFVQFGTDIGMSPAAATARWGLWFALSQLVGWLWSAVMGWLLDRISRLTGVCVAFGLAAVGYLSLGLISNPFGPWMIPVAILVGVGESSAIVASAVLIGQEAPAAIRGAALGASSLAAAAGYMILTYAGGQLFDALGRTTPFIMMALVNGVVFIAALAVRRLHLTDPGVSGA